MLKRILLAVTVIFCLGALAGCRTEEGADKVEITFMHGWGGNLETHQLMQEIYDEFAVQNPDIQFRMIPYADSSIAVEKANDMLSVGKMPDIISTNGYSYYVLNAARRKMAMDLMPVIEADKQLKEQIHPAVLSTWETEDGKLYTIPDAIEAAGYWYNRKYFEAAGLTDENGEAVLPDTWTDFFMMMDRLKKYLNENASDVSVCNLEENQLREFVFLARLAGQGSKGWEMAADSTEKMDTAVMQIVMSDLQRLLTYSDDAENIESARQNFAMGRSVLYFNGVWESHALAERNTDECFQYAAYPSMSGESIAYVSASSGYVFARQEDERKTEACIRFLKYMLSDEVQKKLVLETEQAPSNPNIPIEEIQEVKPLLGKAIKTAYSADRKISTIRSIWSEEKFAIVSDAILSERFREDEVEEMVRKLNEEEISAVETADY